MRIVVLLVLFLSACTGLPKGIEPVADFELDRYLGKWFEIARLDHRFERGLSNVTAEYSIREPGLVNVVNRGYLSEKGEWKEAIGKAKFKDSDDIGHLLVSFFGPFYASYVIFELDDYQTAFVVGNSRDYLWLLSRTPEVSAATRALFMEKIVELGFDPSELEWVVQATP